MARCLSLRRRIAGSLTKARGSGAAIPHQGHWPSPFFQDALRAKDSTHPVDEILRRALAVAKDKAVRRWLQGLLDSGERASSKDMSTKPPRDKNDPTTQSQTKE